MSTEPSRRRGGRWLAIAVLIAVVVAVLWLLPLRYIHDVAVEDVRYGAPAGSAGNRAATAPAGSRDIVVTFSTAHDLTALRRSSGLGFITAELRDCAGAAGSTRAVVDQATAYLSDEGRVAVLPARSGRYRYRVSFPDNLTRAVDHRFERTRASGVPGGLCFALRGGAMWFGYLWSNTTRLGPVG